jgi:sec-independent protein translocase protein TatA
MPLFAIGMPGTPELLVILVIVLIFFGAGRLPEVFGQFGKGIKQFKDAQKDDSLDVTPKLEGKDDIDAAEVRDRVRADDKRG